MPALAAYKQEYKLSVVPAATSGWGLSATYFADLVRERTNGRINIKQIKPIGINAPILVSQKGTVFTIQRINVILKEVKKKYKLKVKNFSCHSLRKTFGRQVYNMNSDNSELALVKLMELFNHSSVAITKRYLGLRQEELLNTYDCLSF